MSKTNQPVIPGKENADPQNNPSWWQYFVAANATTGGSVVMLLVGLLIGYPSGYYTKYKSFKSEGAQIVNQSKNNERLDDESLIKMGERSEELKQNLSSLGYDDLEIDFLLTGNLSTLDNIKNKFNTYIRDTKSYVPREDCADDFLGVESSNEINALIKERFDKVGAKDE